MLIALPHAEREQIKPIVDRALRTHAQVKVLRPAASTAAGLLQNLRDLDLTDLLGREHAPVDPEDIADYLEAQRCSSRAPAARSAARSPARSPATGPARLLLLDRDESLLHEVVAGDLLADAEPSCSTSATGSGCASSSSGTGPTSCSTPPPTSTCRSSSGTRRRPSPPTCSAPGGWPDAAAEFGCERFVHISTDKAADPCSVMGATKRAAELVVFEVGRQHDLPYAAVRFGNVLGSRGSVVPTFLRQILDGGPVTVTNPEMTRYFMTIPEAVSLVLQAGRDGRRAAGLPARHGRAGVDHRLARQMIRLAGLRPDEDIEIEITGPRPGERLHERLHDDAEERRADRAPVDLGASGPR